MNASLDPMIPPTERQSAGWTLHSASSDSDGHSLDATLAMLEALSAWPVANAANRARDMCFDAGLDARLNGVRGLDALISAGIVQLAQDGVHHVVPEALWQQARLWLPSVPHPFPLRYVITQGRRHPVRPPKPVGTVYRRYIPWLGQTLSFRTIDHQADLSRFNRWMNDPVVAAFWQEEGGLDKHRTYLAGIETDPHVLGLIGCFNDEPFGYFETYWAKEDRIAPFCDAGDHDRGWHVLIGEPHFRGRPFVAAWLPSISHYLFLDDCRTRHIVIEPRADNQKMIRNLGLSGYALMKEFDFPHKRAMLGMLSRERFFAERFWLPRACVEPATPASTT